MTASRAVLLAIVLLMVAVAPLDTEPPATPPHASSVAALPAPIAPVGLPPGVSRERRAGIERAVAELEYQVSVSAAGLQAPNRAHSLRTYFEPTGIRVVDRTAEGSPELLRLQVTGWGRRSQMAALEPGEVTSAGKRVEIRRASLVEWYENSPAGLEQGFTLPAAAVGEGPVIVRLSVEGARVSQRGDALALTAPAGQELEYGAPVAYDAAGARLPAWLETNDVREICIAVDDAHARYPVTIDPLLTRSGRLEGGAEGAELGISVAGAGDVNGDGYGDVIVGAYKYDRSAANQGSAFVFYGTPTGIPDGDPQGEGVGRIGGDQAESYLGFSVAGAGDVNGDGYADVIVGAPDYDLGQIDEGAAFLFLGGPLGVWGELSAAAAILQSDQAGAFLGRSVAGAGDVNGDGYADVIVGAYLYDAGQTNEGAGFVFLGGPAGVAHGNPATAATTLQANQTEARLGISVAGAGDVNGDGYADVITGAYHYTAGEDREGAAFVFHGSPSGVASGSPATAATTLQSNQAIARLGMSVAGAGDVNGDGFADVIVGAPYYDTGAGDEGAAYAFHGSATGVASGSPATASTALQGMAVNDFMGSSVAGAGDVNGDGYADVIVGVPGYDSFNADEGAARLYLGGPGGVAETASGFMEAFQDGAGMGTSVAGAGDVNGDGFADVIVGAPSYDGGPTDEGAAFVFLGGGLGVVQYGTPAQALATLESDWGGGLLGTSVAGAGDVNGDGYSDVIVGAPGFDFGEVNEGMAFIFLGGAAGVVDGDPATAATRLQSNQAGAFLGQSVAAAGDVNGDGYADVIVGAPDYGRGQPREGAAFLFLGSATGVANGNPATAAAVLESDQADAQLGWSVAAAGDVNGDGYSDVIVGAPGYDAGQADVGAAFVFLGSAAGMMSGGPARAATALLSDQGQAHLGASVAGAGDVNGDGYADVIVGAPGYDAGYLDDGMAFVCLGGASGVANGSVAAVAVTRIRSYQAGAMLGHSVAGAGDVNGDGYADVIVGAPYYDSGGSNSGAAVVVLGRAVPINPAGPNEAALTLRALEAGAQLGTSVAAAGDVNGDGYADVVIGAPGGGGGQMDEGLAFVFLGSASGPDSGTTALAASQLRSDQANAYLGSSVAGAGDVNGDGFADVIVGAYGYDAGAEDEGAAFVFLGNGGARGRPVLARQRRGDGSGIPVQPWGGSHLDGRFALAMRAVDPAGRGRVRLEAECCPAGIAFGSPGCSRYVAPSWRDVTVSTGGLAFDELISGLASNTLYRWRARVAYAPYGVLKPGIIPPPRPAHGPWRRLQGQAMEADLRIARPGVAVELLRPAAQLAIERVWPNPATGIFAVRFVVPQAEPARVELFDVAGRRVGSHAVTPAAAGRQTVVLGEEGSLPAGIYLVRVTQGERRASARVAILP